MASAVYHNVVPWRDVAVGPVNVRVARFRHARLPRLPAFEPVAWAADDEDVDARVVAALRLVRPGDGVQYRPGGAAVLRGVPAFAWAWLDAQGLARAWLRIETRALDTGAWAPVVDAGALCRVLRRLRAEGRSPLDDWAGVAPGRARGGAGWS